jgi:hypothetical protein
MLESTVTKKILYFFLALFLLLPLTKLIKPLNASTNLDDYAQIIGQNQEDPSLEGFTNSSLSNTVFSLNLGLAGNPYDPENQPGALKTISTYIAAVYQHPPASFQTYYADLKSNFLSKPAYAQGGTGFTGLQPILPVWKAFRNITYSLSAIIFVILGLMIMFRVKISPQAVLTIQAAIPKVVTTLILITFSYAIAGLIIDLSYLIIALVLTTLQASGLSIGGQTIPDITNASFWDMFQLMYRALPMFTLVIIPTLLGLTIGGLLGGTVGITIGTLVLPGAGTVAGGILAGALGAGFGAALITLVVMIIIAIWLIKFFFGVVKCYVQVILKIILAPLEIGIGAFPGQTGGFGNWLKGLVANLAVFPISILFMVIVNAIIEATQHQGAMWAPALVSGDNKLNGIVAGVSGGFIPVVIGFGAVMMLSKLPELIPQAVFAIKPSPFGTAIGETGIPGSIQSAAYSTASRAFIDDKEAPTGVIGGKMADISSKFGGGAAKFIGTALQARAAKK